jgi:membrane protein YdbS with pleckstrin-like domain
VLKVVEATPSRLVLKDQRQGNAVLTGVFTVFSLFSLTVIFTQGIETILAPTESESYIARGLSYLSFLVAVGAFAAVGMMATLHSLRGTTCIFDKADGTLTIERMRLFRLERQHRPIYGVSHLDVEQNDLARAYGLFIVLRSGERIPLAAVPIMDGERIEALRRQIRSFLRG